MRTTFRQPALSALRTVARWGAKEILTQRFCLLVAVGVLLSGFSFASQLITYMAPFALPAIYTGAGAAVALAAPGSDK